MSNNKRDQKRRESEEDTTEGRVWPWEKQSSSKKESVDPPKRTVKRSTVKTDEPEKRPEAKRKPSRPESRGKEFPGQKDSDRDDRKKTRKSYPKGRKSKSSPSSSSRANQEPYLREEIRLNKYIAHAGLCSRREADDYIESGKVKVNGKVVTEMGVKVKPSDKVTVEKQNLSLEPFVYILLNKGKDTISTTDDEKDRNTVMHAIEDATGFRVYPVGRLDRNTMGLLLLSNDGDLAHRLMHPSYKVKKTYEVTANRPLTDEEVANLSGTLELEDGPVTAHSVKRSALDPATVIIAVFEGRNHLIRRMITQIGADVSRLKRIRYAGLTDNDLRVGRWRYLRQKEINDLRKLVKLDTLAFNKD